MFSGRAHVASLLQLIPVVISDLGYREVLDARDQAMLLFSGRVHGVAIDGIDYLQVAPQGEIRQIMVMLRPLRGVTAFAREMGRRAADEGLLLMDPGAI